MSNQFPHQQIDSKWREIWKKNKIYKPNLKSVVASAEVTKSQGGGIKKEKYYALVALPYPSGSGLHVGHMYCFNPVDILARYQRMIGKEVILPIGWDSFGLPAENFAVKAGVHPKITTDKAIENFKWQLELAGFSTDFETHELAAHWENYYKWTQWIFLQLYKDGLAYRDKAPVNWCPSCQTVLANEQVENGKCERCENLVEQKDMEQWFMKITNFSERLYQDLDKVDWPESTKAAQRNWIGRSEGAEIEFEVVTNDKIVSQRKQFSKSKLKVFTTRPDTIYGATFMVIAPEHQLIVSLLKGDGEVTESQDKGFVIENKKEVMDYIDQAKLKSQLERESQKEKTGVEVKGIKAINPITKAEIPIFVADYVLNTYGTGAIMAVPAHDERDGEFAKKYGLEFKQVIAKETGEANEKEDFRKRVQCIVRNQDGKYLMLKWDTGHYTPVSGGIEKGEDATTSAVRELKEETGYCKINNTIELDTQFEHFYAANKDLYRCSETHLVLMDINSSDKVDLKLEENEKGRFESLWVTRDEYLKLVDHDSQDIFNQIDGKKEIITDGRLINSDILNGMTVSEAKKRIIEEFEKLGIGNSKITYRLRDWLISRQRYWGCPIPMVYLGELKIKDEEFKGKSFSYLMAAENITDQDLSNIDVSFNHTDPDTRGCIISDSKLDDYKNLIKEKLSNGFWNEVISENEVWFCFKDKTENISEYILNNDNYNEILAKCNEYVGSQTFSNIYDMLMDNEFYKEYLIREIQAIDEKYLPLKLPTDVEFKPTGESPIAYSQSYKKLAEELYGIGARFEFDTMDTFIDSSWYYMRYLNANDDTKAFDSELCNAWLPTDLYMIGPEHTVLHLMYSRFFTKYFFDKGMINYDEPFYKMRHQGMIAGADGRKMSKRYGNVINPSDICEKYGADTLRVYEMFMGPLEQGKNWSEETVVGVRRFIDRIWNYAEKLSNKEREIQHSEKAQEVVKEFKLTFEPIQESEVREIKRIQVEGWYDNNVSSETGVDVEVLKNIQGMVVPDENTDLSRNTKILTDNSNGNIHLAIKSEGKVIGWLGSFIDIDKDNLRKLALYIDREYRSKGIGSVAMEVIINKANYQDLYLEVVKSNPAVGLYKKFGFIEIGEDKNMLKDNVHYLPVTKMVRYVSSPNVRSELQKLIKYVTINLPELKFNTCIAEFMKFQNLIESNPSSTDDFLTYMKLLAPFAPFITDEIYSNLTNNNVSFEKGDAEMKSQDKKISIHQTNWPKYDESLIKQDEIVIGVQVNGKLRGEIKISDSDDEVSIKDRVMQDTKVTKWFEGKEIKKLIYIQGKIVSIVV